ncbi:MAG: DUF2591 domain-containing protein [Burkholderiaceae bacterium]|nr:DUF2591 domain-containing protein [Burkholderiaceae bacterium]
MKTAELTGATLALWVARAKGLSEAEMAHGVCRVGEKGTGERRDFEPHEDWAQGGPLLDECRMHVAPPAPDLDGDNWTADLLSKHHRRYITASGPTSLVAICRGYVASTYGDTVPDEVA